MPFVLLTGAGFSRNWGGWLAAEAFEYLLGCPELDGHLRRLLWNSKNAGGGFEDALAQLQEAHTLQKSAQTEKPLRDLQDALISMFNSMNRSFHLTNFEPQDDVISKTRDTDYKNRTVRNFLGKFDAIFTLNQDLLLERHYFDNDFPFTQSGRWRGSQFPGMKRRSGSKLIIDAPTAKVGQFAPDENNIAVYDGMQPYFKLHGSSNWVNDNEGKDQPMLIMGGNKALEIRRYPVLNWYHQKFKDCLSGYNVRLMVIGYSFGDHHINEAIVKAAENGKMRLFIIDPNGVDVLDKQNPRNPIRVTPPLQEQLGPYIVGASRRSLTGIFGNDQVEHTKIMQFFVG